MNILLLGSGGREHALAWKMCQSSLCTRLFIAPGNAGTRLCGKNVMLHLHDFESIGAFCLKEAIAMVVVGPEEPLVNGIADHFRSAALKHIMLIGPTAEGAKLEGSKAFAKAFMQRHSIPTAAYREFDAASYDQGIAYLQQHSLPVVLKADGLAAGKGVLICSSRDEAMEAFDSMIREGKFGAAGDKVVVEAFLSGIELSVFVLTDGSHYLLLPEAKDYKRIGEGDAGLNTGGMGAVSPVPFADSEFMQKVKDRIIQPTIAGLAKDGIDYKGIIFAGLIKVGDDPYVIEYNCRLGDPETEVIVPRISNDLVELFRALATGKLNEMVLETDERIACTVMAVSGGYPGAYSKGFPIQGLEQDAGQHTRVYHAGTGLQDDVVVTAGGRVLCVTAFGETVAAAVQSSRWVLDTICFEGMYFRNDIGHEFY